MIIALSAPFHLLIVSFFIEVVKTEIELKVNVQLICKNYDSLIGSATKHIVS